MKKNLCCLLVLCISILLGGCGNNNKPVTLKNKLVNIGSYQGEDIVWRVLDDDGNKILLISDKALDVRQFFGKGTWWLNSSLRAWLSDNFYYAVLPSTVRKYVIPVKKEWESVSYTYENFQYTPWSSPRKELVEHRNKECYYDKIFLLDKREIEKYFDSKELRVCLPTKFSQDKSAWVDKNKKSIKYWLRSEYSNISSFVHTDGSIVEEDNNYEKKDTNAYGVRPAIWVKSTKVLDLIKQQRK